MRTFILAVAALFCFSAIAQFPYNPLPWKQSDFKTIKDKGYTVLNIYVVNDESKDLSTVVEYGSQGLIATMFDKGTNDDGDTINKAETYYKFDGKGRLIQATIKDSESGNGEELIGYTYDAAGRLIVKRVATVDPPTYKYKYNAAGKLAEVYVTQKMALYDKDGEWHGKTFDKPADRYVYKYDAKGRLSEEWDFQLLFGNKSTTPDYKTTWSYNDKGQVVKVRRINSEGYEMYSETYEYNSEGLISSRSHKDGDDVTNYTYEYCKGCKQSWMSAD
jgi:hypothetical protein